MPSRGRHPALAAVLLMLGACLLFAGCGDDGSNPELLSEKTANSLLDDLEEAEAAFDEGDCAKMQRRLNKVLERINDLGGPISKPLKLNLREGTNTLIETAEAECGATEEPAPAPAPEPEPEPTPAPEPETPTEEPDSSDEEEPTPDETNPDQPETPAPEPEPTPEPAPEPEPTPQPEPTPAPTPPSGGVGPGTEAG